MTKSEQVLALIQRQPGLTDQQIRAALGIKHVAEVNAICNKLQKRGEIKREKGPQGLIINVPLGATVGGEHSGHLDAMPPASTAPAASPTFAVLGLWKQLAGLDLAHTLLVIPCSAKKACEGASQPGPRLASSLPPTLAKQLAAAQATVATKIKIDTSAMLPAWQRYQGALYKAAHSALKAATAQHAHLLILSGGYGAVLAEQPIGCYDAVLKPGWWPDHILQQCLAAYAEAHGLTGVVGLAGASTAHAKVICSTCWPCAVKHAFLLSPPSPADGGAMSLVPQALGEAFAALWSGKLNVGWKSAKGLPIALEALG